MAKKIQLQDANGNVLHPLTLGECVTMNNGENLDTLMSKSQMFTPTITQDKSMFKVGTGVDVDYSANVKDGAYESLVFKGKSLVNLASDRTKTFSTSHFLQCKLSQELIKGRKYLLKWEITNNTIGTFDVRFLRTTDGVRGGAFTLDTPKVVTITYDGFDAIEFFTNANAINQGLTATIDNIMVIEYQDEMEYLDIPYFTGIGSVKMPILRNIGKNLYEGKDYQRNVEANKSTGEFPLIMSHVKLKKNTDYCISYSYETNTTRNDTTYGLLTKTKVEKLDRHNALYSYHHDDYEGNGKKGNSKQLTQARFNTGDFEYLYFGVNSVSAGQNGYIKYYNIQLEETSSPTPYEDRKTNILRTSEEIVLREVNGVQDTYNALTGEYVQRIGEVVVTNTVSKSVVVLDNNIRVNIAMSSLNGSNGTTKVNNTLSDKFCWSEANAKDVEGLRVNGNTFHWCVSKNRLTSQDLQGVNTWLQSNPVTIQYELAEPITTIIKPSTMTPFAYQNGHVIVESGFEGQSLLPEIEYSVVTGRTGQVTQNTKVLRQQEQQIIGLEELLLTQVVQMEYERTLLQFDYELQMMMLG